MGLGLRAYDPWNACRGLIIIGACPSIQIQSGILANIMCDYSGSYTEVWGLEIGVLGHGASGSQGSAELQSVRLGFGVRGLGLDGSFLG